MGIHSSGRQVGDDPSDELQPRCRPTRERREPGGGRGRDRVDDRGQEPEPEHERSGREREDVRRHRVDRRLAEVDEDDRRGREATGEGDGKRLRERRRKRQAVELAPDARNGDEDRGDGRERQLEAGLEERRRHPRHQHQRADGEEVPAVARARGEPRERGESSGDGGADDRRLPADGEHVRGDHAERRELPQRSRESEEPAEQEDARGEERDVLPRDGEQVVETGGAEVVLHVVRQPLVLAEHDAENDAAADAGRAAPDGELDPVAKAIADAGNPAASADLPPARRLQDDVDALAREPAALVEAVLRAARLLDRGRVASRIAPRGGERPTGSTRSTRSLYLRATERARHRDDARRPRRRARRGDRDELGDARFAEVGREDALAERIHPQRSPRQPESASATPTATRRAPPPSISARHDCSQRDRAGHRHRNRGPDREREPDARRADEERGPVELDDPPHGVTSSRSCSIRVGPMPGTASRSSTEANGPCSVR